MPTLNIFAGLNGAGKSTLYNYLNSISPSLFKDSVTINPDKILRDIGGNSDKLADIAKSGRIALELIRNSLETIKSFNWETTILSGFALNVISQAKALGYNIKVHFIGVPNVNLSLERIKQRVANGGHNIPDNLVFARHEHQFDNINQVVDNVDEFVFYDNSQTLRIVATYQNKNLTFIDEQCAWVKQALAQNNHNKDLWFF